MAGYVHTCGQCGHHMHIHERYYGRELRCTGCRAAFVAEAPPEEQPVPPGLTDRRSPRTLIFSLGATALILLGLVVVFAWYGSPESGAVHAGRHGAVAGKPGSEILAAFERDAVADVKRAAARADSGDLEELVSSFRAVRLAAGTRFEVLHGGGAGSPVQIRLLSGPWTSKKVWVLPEWVELE